jgi:hypothetical protein
MLAFSVWIVLALRFFRFESTATDRCMIWARSNQWTIWSLLQSIDIDAPASEQAVEV